MRNTQAMVSFDGMPLYKVKITQVEARSDL